MCHHCAVYLSGKVLYHGVFGNLRTDDKSLLDLLLYATYQLLVFLSCEPLCTCNVSNRERLKLLPRVASHLDKEQENTQSLHRMIAVCAHNFFTSQTLIHKHSTALNRTCSVLRHMNGHPRDAITDTKYKWHE